MNDYVILTDSGCDISSEILDQWNIKSVDLSFKRIDQETVYSNSGMKSKDFYTLMRNGSMFQTSAVNPSMYIQLFERVLNEGKNILYIGLSSGLSTTTNMAKFASQELMTKYPKNKIIIMDSLCASAGQGLLVYYAKQKRDSGASLNETKWYLEGIKQTITHWFTVDDLKYLRQGGRIGSAAAFTATILNIKPILHLDDHGIIMPLSKVRGRKKSIHELAEKYRLYAKNREEGVYFISHGDCIEDALFLENLIEQNDGHKATLITNIGPVIGAHSGPGTLALFFEGRQR